MTAPRRVDLEPGDYLRSLTMTEPVRVLAQRDGVTLWRVASEHYVLFKCIDEVHEHASDSMPALLRALPPTWGPFFVAVNPDDCYEVHHYGPEDVQ
jgi:hypothetical protein